MLSITEERIGKIKYTNIAITRGDDATLILPIFVDNNGVKTEYTPTGSDTFALQVRKGEVKNSTPPQLLFQGSLAVVAGKLNWTISASNTTNDCGKYYWDCQITKSGKDYTFYCGWFTILPEATIATP